MRTRDFECRSWEQADKLLGKRNSRTVCNNTRLVRQWPFIMVKLHGNVIAEFHHRGSPTFSDGGWRTVTTKQRLNRCLPIPWQVYQEKFEWTLRTYRTGKDFPFPSSGSAVPSLSLSEEC